MENHVLKKGRPSRLRYEISGHCVVCWRCKDTCPTAAIVDCEISVTDTYSFPGVRIEEAECSHCGTCKDLCPVEAIIIVNE